MVQPRSTPATYADIEALPETLVGEIMHGVLYTHPRPAPRHGQASSSLGYELIGPFEAHAFALDVL